MKLRQHSFAATRGRRAMRGQSLIEYVIVTALAVLILVEGGNSSVVRQVLVAMKQAYQGFTYAVGNATNLNIF